MCGYDGSWLAGRPRELGGALSNIIAITRHHRTTTYLLGMDARRNASTHVPL